MNNEDGHWFLLYCKSREEQRAVDNLKQQNIESFFVSIPIEKIIRRKKVIKEVALFPNYIFVNLNTKSDNFNSVRSTRGVSNFVKCGIEYIKVPTSLIISLQTYHEKKVAFKFENGDALFIDNGAFQGLNAIYQCSDGLERSIILVNMLQEQSKVSIPNTDIKKYSSTLALH